MDFNIIELNKSQFENILVLMKQFYLFENIPFNAEHQKVLLQKLFDNKHYGTIYGFLYNNSLIGYSVITKGFSL